MSEMKDFEIPIPKQLKDRLDKLANADGQATTAFARSLLLDGVRAKERHEIERANYEAGLARQNNPPKSR